MEYQGVLETPVLLKTNSTVVFCSKFSPHLLCSSILCLTHRRRHRKGSLRRAGTGAAPASQGQEVAPSGPGVPTGSGVVTSGGTRARDAAMVVDLTSSSSTSAAVASATRLSSAGVIGRPVKGIKSSMQTGVGAGASAVIAGASAVIAGAAGGVGNGNNVSNVAGGSSGSGRERVVGDRSLSVPAGYSMGTAKGMVRRGGTGGLIGGGAAGGGEGWRRYVYPSGTVYEGDMVDDKREVRFVASVLCVTLSEKWYVQMDVFSVAFQTAAFEAYL